jgi:hypothetical protein
VKSPEQIEVELRSFDVKGVHTLSVGQAAKVLGIRPTKLRTLIEAVKIEAFRYRLGAVSKCNHFYRFSKWMVSTAACREYLVTSCYRSAYESERARLAAAKIKPRTEKDLQFDLGLAVLSYHLKPGDRLTIETIAEVCGVSPQRICQIQDKALRKLRRRMRCARLRFEDLAPADM